MKKLLQGSVALLIFSISIMIFQTACKKEALADVAPTTTQLTQSGLLIYQTSTGGVGIENYDGTSATPLNIVLPTGSVVSFSESPSISPDHKTIFFSVHNQSTNAFVGGYSCNIDGTNPHKIDNSGYHIAF